MTCPRCAGCLVEDFDPDLREHLRCANCGCRPAPEGPAATAAPARRVRLRRGTIDRPAARAALIACGAALGRAPTRNSFEAHCRQAGLPWRPWHLTGHPYYGRWIAWPEVLRDAGFEPTRTQIAVSRGYRRLTAEDRCR